MLNEVKHLAILGKIRLKLRETLRFAQGDKIFNTLILKYPYNLQGYRGLERRLADDEAHL
jgi:hypothetical protein